MIARYALAGVVLAALVAGGWGWTQKQRGDELALALEAARARVGVLEDAARGNGAAVRELERGLQACVALHAEVGERNRRAAAAAQARIAELEGSLSDWRDRYADATRDPGCADALAVELCPAVLDY